MPLVYSDKNKKEPGRTSRYLEHWLPLLLADPQ
jgi:hypothetical protein